jgi:hypothetical protein
MFVADDTVLNELASIFATSPRSAAATGAVRRARRNLSICARLP